MQPEEEEQLRRPSRSECDDDDEKKMARKTSALIRFCFFVHLFSMCIFVFVFNYFGIISCSSASFCCEPGKRCIGFVWTRNENRFLSTHRRTINSFNSSAHFALLHCTLARPTNNMKNRIGAYHKITKGFTDEMMLFCLE